MSAQAFDYVTGHSQHRGNELLCLLMIASYADENGEQASPGVEQLARDCRLCERQVRRIIDRLETSGELRVQRGRGRGNVHLFTVVMPQNSNDIKPDISDKTGHFGTVAEGENRTFSTIKPDKSRIKPDISDKTGHFDAPPSSPPALSPDPSLIPLYIPPGETQYYSPVSDETSEESRLPVEETLAIGEAETSPEQGKEPKPKPSKAKVPMFNPDNKAHTLLAAFRSVRYPGEPALSHTELSEYARSLRDAAADNVTPEQMRAATETALRTWSKVEMVNPRSVIRHMNNLLKQANNERPKPNDQRGADGMVQRAQGGARHNGDVGTPGNTPARNGVAAARRSAFPSAAEIIEQRMADARRMEEAEASAGGDTTGSVAAAGAAIL